MYFIQRVLSNNLGSRDVVGWAPRWKQPSTSSPESVEAGRTRTESVVSVFSAVRIMSPVELFPRGRNKHRTSLLGAELVAVAVTVTSGLSTLEMQRACKSPNLWGEGRCSGLQWVHALAWLQLWFGRWWHNPC